MCGDSMGIMTLSIPDEVRKEMKLFSEVKWSEVARKAIQERLETLQMAEKLARKSRLSAKDAEDFSRKITASATEGFLNARRA